MAERITRFTTAATASSSARSRWPARGRAWARAYGRRAPAAAKIAEIAHVPGVAAVQAQVMLPLSTTTSHFLTLTQELILGMDLSVPMPNRHYRALPVRAGRFLRPDDRRAVVVGADFAASRGLAVGGTLPLGSLPLTVIGVLDKTLTAPDRFAIVSIEDARDLWLRRDPPSSRSSVGRGWPRP